MNREAQRITCRTKAFKPENETGDKRLLDVAKNAAAKLKMFCALLFIRSGRVSKEA